MSLNKYREALKNEIKAVWLLNQKDASDIFKDTVETIFWILIFIAALGGLAVIIGGLLIYKEHVVIGKILITLGAGIGIIGLIIGIITSVYSGKADTFFSWLTTSFAGIGVILTIIARFMAKRPEKDDSSAKKSKRR